MPCLLHRPFFITKTEHMSQSPENGRGLVLSKSSAVSDGSAAAPCDEIGTMQRAVKQ